MGSPGVSQLDVLLSSATGIPTTFQYHPFRFIDFCEQASIRKEPAQRSAVRTTERRRHFYMDFGFMRASSSDLQHTTKPTDRIVHSYDGFTSYLLIVDEATRYVWVFLTHSKEPPIAIVSEFLHHHGHDNGGCVRTDQGGELARSQLFKDTLLWDFHYIVEPTGADSPSQNGAVEIYNDKFGVRTRSLLYGSGLPAKYWSATLLHLVYLHNCLVHSSTKKTPFESYYGHKPDLSGMKVFSSQVCIRRSGQRCAKLDHHDFTGIFLGYAATNQNIIYLDLTTGIIKNSHHAQFGKAWYLQQSRPPAAQLLYDLGLEFQSDDDTDTDMSDPTGSIPSPWPPAAQGPIVKDKWSPPRECIWSPLPLQETAAPRPITAAAASVYSDHSDIDGTLHRLTGPRLQSSTEAPTLPVVAMRIAAKNASGIVSEFQIGKHNMATIYLSPNPYFDAFEEVIDI